MRVPSLVVRARQGRLGWSGPERDLWPDVMLALAAAGSVVIVGLLLVVVWLSFQSDAPAAERVSALDNYLRVYSDPTTYAAMLNTVGFALTSLIVSFLFGVPIAWLVERTDFPAKTALATLMTVGLLIPTFLVGMGWLFLLHPRIGILNQLARQLFGVGDAALSVTTVPGMGWVEGLSLTPLAFIMTAAVFRAMDPSLEEAAQMSGASTWTTLRKVTLPVAWPALLGAGIYIVTIGIAAFDIPATIGLANKIYTFSTYIYLNATPHEAAPRYGSAAAMSAFVMLVAVGFGAWYNSVLQRARNYEVVTGKAYQPKLVRLGPRVALAWAFVGFYLLCGFVAPILMLVWASLFPFLRVPSAEALSAASLANFEKLPWDLILRGAQNTALLMVLVPTCALVVSLAFSWIVLRSRLPGRSLFDTVAFLPHVVPSIIFGVGALFFSLFLVSRVLPIYGTVWVLLLVFVVIRISFGTRMLNSALIQLHRELEEAAYVSGARTWDVLVRVLIPLLAPAILYAWLWIALLTYRELTVATLLTTPGNLTLPIVVWSFWLGGGLGQASAAAIVMVALLSPIIAVYWLIARRTGIGPQR